LLHQRIEVPFAHPAIAKLIQKAIYLRLNTDSHKDVEKEIPAAAIALACTAVRLSDNLQAAITNDQPQLYCALHEWQTGWHIRSNLTEEAYHTIYNGLLDMLAELRETKKDEIYEPLLRSYAARCQ
jgi:Domain of unknown function (DUF6532)